MNHKEILLYGFHFSFFIVFSLAVVRDLFFVHYFNAGVNFTALLLSFVSYFLLHYKCKNELSSYVIMFIAIFPLYFLIYFNHFENLVIVYVILLPIAAFFLLEFKPAIVVSFLMYILLIVMLYHIHQVDPSAPILNNPLALINIVFASIFILFFGVFYHLAIDSSLKSLINSNRQKDILLKEVHHRVKNNLNITASMLGLQSSGKSKETKEELLRSKERIETIALVHEMLYKQEDFERIDFKDYIKRLSHLLSASVGGKNEVDIQIIESENIALALNIMIQLGLIMNELLTNSFKYAKVKDILKIEISLDLHEGYGYRFLYRDNGEDVVEVSQLQKGSGLGLRIIELCVKQLNGKFDVEYDEGVKYEILF